MNLPIQFEITDIISYTTTGLLYLLWGYFIYYQMTGVSGLSLEDLNVLKTFLLVPIAYVVGFVAPSFASFYLKKDSQKQNKLLRFFLAVENNYDKRVPAENSLTRSLTQDKLLYLFGVDFSSLPASKQHELFYIVRSYVKSHGHSNIVHLVKRNKFIFNLYARATLLLVVLNSSLICFIGLKLFFNIGQFHITAMLPVLVITLLLTPYASKRSQKFIRIWSANIWRAFIVIPLP